jgi:hypothetical protein
MSIVSLPFLTTDSHTPIATHQTGFTGRLRLESLAQPESFPLIYQ